ncbi:MAG: NHL repeat-containing protein [Turneriella sp.]|nr:NHL repeat-containing protein [Turneriella sp.]
MAAGCAQNFWYWLVILATCCISNCNGELERFLSENRALSLEIISSTISTPYVDTDEQEIAFSVTFRVDREGHYTFVHGNSCNTGKPPAGIPVSGTVSGNEERTSEIKVSIADIAGYGRSLELCASDVGNYQRASRTLALQPALDYLAQLNEATGQGLLLNSAIAGEFAVFQKEWTAGNPDRGEPTTSAAGVHTPLQFAAFVDPNDNYRIKFFVVDRMNHRVLIFHQRPKPWGEAAVVVIGQPDFSSNSPNGGGAVNAAGLNFPASVAVSAQGQLFVSDTTNNRVLIFNSIPKNHGQPADYAIGQPDLDSNLINHGGLAWPQRLFAPLMVSIYHGKLFIVDHDNNRVLVFNSLPSSTAPYANFAIGQPNMNTVSFGVNYTLSDSYLRQPISIAFGGERLYLSDYGNHRVLVFNSIPAVDNTKPSYVIGQNDSAGFNPNCGLITPSQNCLRHPAGLSVVANKLAIADYGNKRVLIFSLPVTNNFPPAAQVLGQPDFISHTPATSQTGLRFPCYVLFDNGYLWIIDQGNHRLAVRQLPQ